MCSFVEYKLCALWVMLLGAGVVVSEGKPQSPSKFYAMRGETAEIPCVLDGPKNKLRWYPEQPSKASPRASSHLDQDDSELFVHVIKDVQVSDAGRYVCHDGRFSSKTQLVVIVPSPVRDSEANSNGPDEIKVKWRAPANNPDAISGYNIFLTEVAASGKEVKFTVDTVSPDGVEEFPITDFSPGSTYKIQVAPLYLKGTDDVGETTEGPRSPPVSVATPEFKAASWKVRAEPGANNTILVTWRPPQEEEDRGVDGYLVYYQGLAKKDPPSGEVTVPAPPKGGQGRAVLRGLKLKQKYRIHVAAYTGGPKKVAGSRSQGVVIAHDGFVPELSIRAVALSPDTVMVSVETVGGDKVEKLRLLYSDDSAIKWDKVEGYNFKENYVVISGLQPKSRYFFTAKAAVNKKARSVVTHVFTPPAVLPPPTNVTVTAQSDSSVLVTWKKQQPTTAKGHVVLVDKIEEPGSPSSSPEKHYVVLKGSQALVEGLQSDQQYRVKVEPFDYENVGTCSDPILFQLAEGNQTTPSAQEPAPPRFVDEQPEELQINAGEEVTLTCTAIGTPPPMVQWLKNNQAITQPAEHVSRLVLPGVTEPVLLTCVANNSAGSVERHTEVLVSPELESEEPKFLQLLPETLIVSRGTNIRQVCEASGYPVPTITWAKDGVPATPDSSKLGQSVFTENRVTRHFNLTCTARNRLGWTESTARVYLQELLRKPFFTSQLPRTIEQLQGGQLILPCSMQGNPAPLVTWLDGNTVLAPSTLGQNVLKIESVSRPTTLTCRGDNLAGRTEENVQLTVMTRGAEPQPLPDYKVTLKRSIDSPSSATVRWAVDRGRLGDIRQFDIRLLNDLAQTLVSQRLNSQQRSMTLSRLSPQNTYTVNVATMTSRGVVDNSSITFTTRPDQDSASGVEPVIYLDVVEIRDDNARLEFISKNIDPRAFHSYRLLVKDLGARALGNTILTKDGLSRAMQTIALDRLKPRSRYQAIIQAMSRSGAPLLEANANFSTPSEGQYGVPVSVSSEAEPPQATSSTHQAEETTPSRPEPVVPRTRPTQVPQTLTTVLPSLAPPTVSEASSQVEETRTTERSEDDYTMTVKIPNKTPFKVDIRWTVDRGNLENVKDFTVTIKGVRGQTLLKQTLPKNQRYITIQPLSPDTKYFVNVMANGPDGVLAESDVDFQTGPADQVQDTSNPILELEANEVRAESARIDWTVLNVDPDLVKSYRLQVLDGGPSGFNLLSQKLHPSSQSLSLQELQHSKNYHVIVDALGDGDNVLMSSSLTFETAAPNQFGVPVHSSSSPAQAKTPQDAQRPDVPHGDAPTPILALKVNPGGNSSTALTWTTRNVPPGLLQGYFLRVRSNGPEGTLLLQTAVPLQSSYFKLDGLVRDRRYFLELDAVARNGSPVLRAATPYTPGRSVTPLEVSSTPGQGVPTPQGGPEVTDRNKENDRVPGDSNTVLDMELNPVDRDNVKVNWTVGGGSSTRPINSFKVKVHVNGPEGQVLLEKELRTNTVYYAISGLQENTNYFIRLEALDKDGRLIQHVTSPYLVPPPGHPVEPIKVSSASNQNAADQSTAAPRDRGPNNGELVITKAEPQGQNAVLVEWFDVTSDVGRTSRNTMVRYAEFRDNERDNFKIEAVPAEQGRFLIRNLKANSVYGIQVASLASANQFVRWSKLVRAKTTA